MIYTNEPANQFYVYLTAYRATNTHEVNEKFTDSMIKEIRKYPGLYGVIESVNHTGCFREAGQALASIERTLCVRARDAVEAAQLTDLACRTYEQDAVLVVSSQTHTAALWSVEKVGEYPQQYEQLVETPLNGSFQMVDAPTGECYTLDDAGYIWEVI